MCLFATKRNIIEEFYYTREVLNEMTRIRKSRTTHRDIFDQRMNSLVHHIKIHILYDNYASLNDSEIFNASISNENT
jgi:hypothetical protein